MGRKRPGADHELLVSLPSPCSSGSGLSGRYYFSLAVSAEVFKCFGDSIHKLGRRQQIHRLMDEASRAGLSFSTILQESFWDGHHLALNSFVCIIHKSMPSILIQSISGSKTLSHVQPPSSLKPLPELIPYHPLLLCGPIALSLWLPGIFPLLLDLTHSGIPTTCLHPKCPLPFFILLFMVLFTI